MKDPSRLSEDGSLAMIDPRVLVGLCLGVLAAPRAAVADGVGCVPVVRAERLGGAWARALEAVRRGLAARDDVDHCVELVVTAEARRIRVVVRLAAGGDATRLVESPDDLEPTILALLLVPSRPAPVAAPEPPPAPIALPRLEARVTPEPPTGNSVRMALAPPAAPAATARFEVGIAVGARWRNALALGAGGVADVALGPWLIGATGQWSAALDEEVIPLPGSAGADPMTTTFTTRTTELGVELGRRFALGPVELTGLLGPRLALISRRFASSPAPVTVVSPFTGETTTLRFAVADTTRAAALGSGLRARWAGSRRLQLVLGLDVSVDLATSRENGLAMMTNGDLVAVLGPERPRWGVAFTIGGLFQVSP